MRPVRLAGLGLAFLAVVALPAAAASPESEYSITVSAKGFVRAVPQVADWSFGVVSEARTAAAALRENSDKTRSVIRALKTGGVDARDLRTEQVVVYPRWSGTAVAGYTAANSVRISAGWDESATLIDLAVIAGANRVYGPLLTRSQTDELYERALANAYDTARQKALVLAAKANVTLGRPLSISEAPTGAYPPYVTAAASAAAPAPTGTGSAPPPLEPGEREIQASVTVKFETS